MSALSTTATVDVWTLSEAETVALAYLRDADNDRWAALVRLAQDALADQERSDAVIRERGRLISHGYIRSGVGH